MVPSIQDVVVRLRRIVPRGWAPVIMTLARFIPRLRAYPVKLRNGDHLVVDLRQRMCFEVFFNGERTQEVGTEKLLARILKEGDVCVDVGANIGCYTRFASQRVGKTGTVLACEPAPIAFRLLQTNTGDLANVRSLQIALGNTNGKSEFFVRDDGESSSLNGASALSRNSKAHSMSVDIRTLDSVLSAYPRVDFIKIDVEGFEREVIEGAREVIRRHEPIVYFEYLDGYAADRGFSVDSFRELFDAVGYSLRWINHSSRDPALFSGTPSDYLVAAPNSRIASLESM